MGKAARNLAPAKAERMVNQAIGGLGGSVGRAIGVLKKGRRMTRARWPGGAETGRQFLMEAIACHLKRAARMAATKVGAQAAKRCILPWVFRPLAVYETHCRTEPDTEGRLVEPA